MIYKRSFQWCLICPIDVNVSDILSTEDKGRINPGHAKEYAM